MRDPEDNDRNYYSRIRKYKYYQASEKYETTKGFVTALKLGGFI
jgi:hypothetical protein